MNNKPHEKHRERLKARVKREGLDNFEPHNALEVLLFYSIPQSDTNELAHSLLSRFGSFSGVLEASYEQLLSVKGIGPHSASLIKFIPEISRYYSDSKNGSTAILNSLNDIGNFLLPKFLGKTNEQVIAIALDNKLKVLKCDVLHVGTVHATEICIRKLIEFVIDTKATQVVISHNHPSGTALPSADDFKSTNMIIEALKPIKVRLIDHVIVADGDYISFSESGYI